MQDCVEQNINNRQIIKKNKYWTEHACSACKKWPCIPLNENKYCPFFEMERGCTYCHCNDPQVAKNECPCKGKTCAFSTKCIQNLANKCKNCHCKDFCPYKLFDCPSFGRGGCSFAYHRK